MMSPCNSELYHICSLLLLCFSVRPFFIIYHVLRFRVPLISDTGKHQVQGLLSSNLAHSSGGSSEIRKRNFADGAHKSKEPILCPLEDERYLPGYDN